MKAQIFDQMGPTLIIGFLHGFEWHMIVAESMKDRNEAVLVFHKEVSSRCLNCTLVTKRKVVTLEPERRSTHNELSGGEPILEDVCDKRHHHRAERDIDHFV